MGAGVLWASQSHWGRETRHLDMAAVRNVAKKRFGGPQGEMTGLRGQDRRSGGSDV